ncbi:Protein CBG11567 [Caenorhabditis briggsae]|uniref:Uncharacterized protein n=2 Tax=Caenorhabditis briggsae TaxID=6238 RepID=A0AAE9F7A7_CAEBR|nr:Protein CBG11567 [Caenorhabditis briggsae]ULT91097.1 hypothetical protein L3Y34_009008 [Caenorhabditis briggsae]UMM36863.1 hypothetical protein L5515_008837 [Caenorhabditis briggsae]CAP30702.1 Protein CBG11567 [Caenorhabditis briggsae]
MKFILALLVILGLVATGGLGYNIPIRKRLVDMRSLSLYDFPEDYYMAQQEEQRQQHYINPKPNYVTAFYPIYDFGKRR